MHFYFRKESKFLVDMLLIVSYDAFEKFRTHDKPGIKPGRADNRTRSIDRENLPWEYSMRVSPQLKSLIFWAFTVSP